MNYSLFLLRLHKVAQVISSPRLLRALVCAGVLAGVEHRRKFAPDLGTVVDIGANRGQFTLAVRQWAPKARAIAFEPLSNAAEAFRKLFQGDSRVTLHQVAIGPKAGEAIIHVSQADDSSSLLPISLLQAKLFPGTNQIGTETVKVGRLSDIVSRDEIVSPALLKIDVQGYELDALKGCVDYLDAFDYVIAEGSFVELYEGQALAHELICFLDEKGFVLTDVYNVVRSQGAAIQGEFAFGKKGQRHTTSGTVPA